MREGFLALESYLISVVTSLSLAEPLSLVDAGVKIILVSLRLNRWVEYSDWLEGVFPCFLTDVDLREDVVNFSLLNSSSISSMLSGTINIGRVGSYFSVACF